MYTLIIFTRVTTKVSNIKISEYVFPLQWLCCNSHFVTTCTLHIVHPKYSQFSLKYLKPKPHKLFNHFLLLVINIVTNRSGVFIGFYSHTKCYGSWNACVKEMLLIGSGECRQATHWDSNIAFKLSNQPHLPEQYYDYNQQCNYHYHAECKQYTQNGHHCFIYRIIPHHTHRGTGTHTY